MYDWRDNSGERRTLLTLNQNMNGDDLGASERALEERDFEIAEKRHELASFVRSLKLEEARSTNVKKLFTNIL